MFNWKAVVVAAVIEVVACVDLHGLRLLKEVRHSVVEQSVESHMFLCLQPLLLHLMHPVLACFR